MRSRAAKIQHDRFSLPARIGFVVQEYSKLGGYLTPSMGIKLSDGPGGSVALSKVPLGGAGSRSSPCAPSLCTPASPRVAEEHRPVY